MPLPRQWFEAEDEDAAIFERAFTNSGATNVSIPALLTGVGPHESVDLLLGHQRRP